MFEDSVDNDKLSMYNLDKMRPAIREFSDLIRKNIQIISEEIKSITNNPIGIFCQLEFWLLLIGLAPYFYFLGKIISILARMFFWDLFP